MNTATDTTVRPDPPAAPSKPPFRRLVVFVSMDTKSEGILKA
jgi:hypothetical protein